MIHRVVGKVKGHLDLHWKKVLLFGGGGLLATIVALQFLYPTGALLPFTTIDNVNLTGWAKADATKRLDQLSTNQTIPIYFGDATGPYRSPKPVDIGLKVSNAARVNAVTYPWYLRIVPSSFLWAHFFVHAAESPNYIYNLPVLKSYITKELGESCNVSPKNASLKVSGMTFEVIKSSDGGTCRVSDVTKALSTVQPQLTQDNRVTIPMKKIAPQVSNTDAKTMADAIKAKAGSGVNIQVGSATQVIPVAEAFGWMDFTTKNNTLDFTMNVDRSSAYLGKEIAPKVMIGAGVTQVSTHDFIETSRQTGTSGQTLNNEATLAQVKAYLAGVIDGASAVTALIEPSVVYTRSYSSTDTGLSALMKNFAESHPGTYGISMVEMDGQHRRATYNDTAQFTTASTFKLFVAYSTLTRIEAGTWHWTDQIQGGRDLTKCFDDMIVKSDNACAEALLTKIGYTAITNEAHAVGCTSTSFMGKDGIKSTAADEALLLGMLQSGQILSQQSSRDTWINAMKRNIYRQGIPAGATGTVADKVGFLDALLHDAAIVYSPSGTYVLVIMTDHSSWANIADLTRQIEALRIQP